MAAVPGIQGVAADLFGSDIRVLPKVRPDETLYSWCAAYHRISGNTQPRTTSVQLFGHPSAVFHIDFPLCLDYLTTVTYGHLGSATDIALQRTQAGFHAPFLPPDMLCSLLSVLRGSTHGGLKASLGLPRSSTNCSTELKACRDCIAEDRSVLCYSYWRASHQWASSAICLIHKSPLQTFHLADETRQVRSITLPSDVPVDRWKSIPRLTSNTVSKLISIARWGQALATGSKLHLDENVLRLTYLLKAKQRGWIAMDGTVRLQKIANAFGDFYLEVATLPGWTGITETSGANAGFLGALLRQYPGRRHPLKHILMMNFLFEGVDEFISTYRMHQAVAEEGRLASLRAQLTDTRQTFITLVSSAQLSPNQAAQKLGLPISQAVKHLDRLGVPRKLRPHLIGTDKEDRLRKMLYQGIERRIICTQLGIRDGLIKDYLARNAEVRATWIVQRNIRVTSENRKRFQAILAANPGLSIKAIRRLPGNAFQWLYNNDREWLKANLPGLWHR